MPDFAPANLASIYSKESALNRAVDVTTLLKNQGDMQMQESKLADKAAIAKMMPNMPTGPDATGDQMRKFSGPLFALDPAIANGLIAEAGRMDTAAKENRALAAEHLAKASVWIGQAGDPAEATRRAQYTISELGTAIPTVAKLKPEDLAQNWQFYGALALNIKDVFTDPTLQTANQQNVAAEGLKPGTPDYQQRLQQLDNPTALVNVDNKTETAYDAARGKDQAQQMGQIEAGANAARSVINAYDQLDTLLATVDTGTWKTQKQQLKSAAKSVFGDDFLTKLGITDDTPATQAASSIINQLVLKFRSASTGEGMPGAMSDRDVAFLQDIPPGLEQNPQARRLMIDFAKRTENRKLEMRQQAAAYEREKGRFDAGFWDRWDDYTNKNPLFTDEDTRHIAGLSGGLAGTPVPGAAGGGDGGRGGPLPKPIEQMTADEIGAIQWDQGDFTPAQVTAAINRYRALTTGGAR